jgi:HD-like signal output (HDOD) protein
VNVFGFLKKRNVNPKERLREVLGELVLPTFPAVTMQILTKIREPETGTSEISDLIALDPKLTVQVLQTVNSASYSSRRRIENVYQAVSIIGMTQLESIVLSISLGQAVPRQSSPGYEFKRFWKASCRRGVTARALASILCPTKDAECFSTGFLQDVAIPFIAHGNTDNYGRILESWHSGDEVLLAELERKEFGWDHAEIATLILSEWGLPESLALAIGGHHDHTQGHDVPPPVLLVGCLGETEANVGTDRLIEMGSRLYAIPEKTLEQLLEASFESADELASLMC